MILEDFTTPVQRGQPVELDRAMVFDEGYREGWSDAASALKDDDLRLGAAVAAHLETIAHTQQTAMALCLAQIEPLLTEIFDKILPRAADRAFLSIILDEAEKLLRADPENVLTIRLAPEALGPLHDLFDQAGVDLRTVTIEPEPGLDPMQAHVAHPEGEREIDLGRLLDSMDEAFDTMRQSNESQRHD